MRWGKKSTGRVIQNLRPIYINPYTPKAPKAPSGYHLTHKDKHCHSDCILYFGNVPWTTEQQAMLKGQNHYIQCLLNKSKFIRVKCVISSFAIILMGRRVMVVLLCLSSWCLVIVIVLWLFLVVPLYGLQCVIVVFPAHTHSLCFVQRRMIKRRLKIHQTVQKHAADAQVHWFTFFIICQKSANLP